VWKTDLGEARYRGLVEVLTLPDSAGSRLHGFGAIVSLKLILSRERVPILSRLMKADLENLDEGSGRKKYVGLLRIGMAPEPPNCGARVVGSAKRKPDFHENLGERQQPNDPA
jgi:hypothetical protein